MAGMKTCPNCRCVYADEYVGGCTECGNPMAGTEANGSGDLAFRYARQVMRTQDELSLETRMKSAFDTANRTGDSGALTGFGLNESAVAVAKQFVTVNHEMLKEAGAE